ncbi:hypothetical protein [Methylotenera sp.]|uniref:hypothetical protein n=1 Tax=Methylotenera sp. TaxID=2051956 RepID=UPI0024875A96|nr:hypothetical protein [Methylotenera sp.]MDI1360644.1 hypothetical protein [Methylotenera sp.]
MNGLVKLYKAIVDLPTINNLIQAELAEAQRQLLVAETALEHAASKVSFNIARVERLSKKLQVPRTVVGIKAVINP